MNVLRNLSGSRDRENTTTSSSTADLNTGTARDLRQAPAATEERGRTAGAADGRGRSPSIVHRVGESLERAISRSISRSGRSASRDTRATGATTDTIRHTTGRGGAGNMVRSSSRSRENPETIEEDDSAFVRAAREKVRAEQVAAGIEPVRSAGRGGAGNMSNSRSRSRGRALDGVRDDEAGKERLSSAQRAEAERELEKKTREEYELKKEGTTRYVATGRGGIGNAKIKSPTVTA